MSVSSTTFAVGNSVTKAAKKVRILVVDDSPMTQWLISEILKADKNLLVVGTASNALEAREQVKKLAPDVITLDIEMPGMNGLDFLKNLMRLHPLPVVMVSSLTEHGADVTLDALALGAVDFVCKPKMALSADALAEYSRELVTKVRTASTARVSALCRTGFQSSEGRTGQVSAPANTDSSTPSRRIIAIGASTGGTEAVCDVLKGLPVDGPGIVLVQHISDMFNAPFVRRLNTQVPMHVCQARHGDIVRQGCVHVAPAGRHLRMRHTGDSWHCVLSKEGRVNYHQPSVDVLFHSIAAKACSDTIGIILTGMGNDGAKGLAAMRSAGAYTIAQDELSSVVWGMPGASVKLGAADEVAPLGEIAQLIRSRSNSLS